MREVQPIQLGVHHVRHSGKRPRAALVSDVPCAQDTSGSWTAIFWVSLILICVHFALNLMLVSVADAFKLETANDPRKIDYKVRLCARAALQLAIISTAAACVADPTPPLLCSAPTALT